jgi:hypothetical protein
MMNTIKKILVAGFLVLSLSAGSNISVAGVTQEGMGQPINNTIAHLESALKAVNTNELETAQEHIKAAGQSSKDIIGGSLEVKTQRGSRAIATARRQTKEGNTVGAAVSLKEAIGVYKSLLGPLESGSRGGLK